MWAFVMIKDESMCMKNIKAKNQVNIIILSVTLQQTKIEQW